MQSIKPKLTPEIGKIIVPESIDSSKPFPVDNYQELVKHVAKLAYMNKDYLLFYRGQSTDYKNRTGASTFYPSIYRGDYLRQREITYRFDVLNEAARQIRSLFRNNQIEGHTELARKTYIQWSILQHYGVCDTPLLDLTHSLRVACSFAQDSDQERDVFVYVFGLPYITNRISINSEQDTVIIRLLSICPPDALRPYFQEGYLAGTTDITTEYESKTELDLKNRLVAKFVIPNHDSFWGTGFSKIPHSLLYPGHDRVENLCKLIAVTLHEELQPGDLGSFLQEWTKLESMLKTKAGQYKDTLVSTRQAISLLLDARAIDRDAASQLDQLRKFRNVLVHEPESIEAAEVHKRISQIQEFLEDLNRQ